MKEKTAIVFTGDIGFDRYMAKRWEDEKLLAQPVLDFFRSADHTAANVEGALFAAPEDPNRSAYFHAMDPAAIGILQKMGADIWVIGNNHITDAGAEGVRSTLDLAAKHGAKTVGAGMEIEEASAPVYLEEAGGIGILSVSYMNNCVPATENAPGILRWDDWTRIGARIAEIKARSRWCIIVAHGGEEFAPMPLPYIRDRYVKFLELGADVVVGHHPHVPEHYELFENGKAIFYSLGNFIFDTDYQRAHRYTDIGVLLKLIFTAEKFDFEAMGIRILRGEERIEACPLPEIFTDISAEEYALLSPWGAKAFLEEDKRKMIYLEPERFTDCPQKVWDDYCFSEEPDGFCKGAHMDLSIAATFAATADDSAWQKSKLERVKAYLHTLL